MIRRCPNGGTPPGNARRVRPESIGADGKPGEVKHLSIRRKRNHRDSLSSGERKGKSPNFRHVKVKAVVTEGLKDAKGKTLNFPRDDRSQAKDLERSVKEGDSPVAEDSRGTGLRT